jgi:hypothetical protein
MSYEAPIAERRSVAIHDKHTPTKPGPSQHFPQTPLRIEIATEHATLGTRAALAAWVWTVCAPG